MRMLLAPLMVVLVAANALARDGSRGFSNSDIKGNYSWLAQGSSIVPGDAHRVSDRGYRHRVQ